MFDDSYYRRQVQQTIDRVRKATDGLTEDEFKKHLKQAYPFGERKGRAYRIWRELTQPIFRPNLVKKVRRRRK